MQQSKDSSTLAYIKHVLDSLRISPTSLAKMAGISATTLTRPLNNPNHKFNLSATTLNKIASASGVSPGPFFENKDYTSTVLAKYSDPSMYDQEIWGYQPSDQKSVVVIGYAGLGIWQEIGVLHSDFIGSILVAPIDYKPSECFAVIVRDSHLSEFAYMNDIVLCTKLKNKEIGSITGGLVILERRKEGGRLIEITGRRVQKSDTGWHLTTLGRGNPHRYTMKSLEGDENASVTGKVICALRYPR